MARYRRSRATLALFLALPLLLAGLRPAPALAAPSCEITRDGAAGGGDLAAAIADAGCPTITFAPGVTDLTVGSYPTIARDLTIQGSGRDVLTIRHTGGYSATGSVFVITAGVVVLNDLTIADGRSQGIWGAGLSIVGLPAPVSVTLNRVMLRANIARAAGGGAIYASNATLALNDTIVSGNLSDNATLDLGWGGGGLFLDDYYGNLSATLTNSIIKGNEALNNHGGGIRVWDRADGKSATLTLNGSDVSLNLAYFGGGIANFGGTATLNGSTITGNNASYVGGGLSAYYGTTTVTNSTVSDNTAQFSGGIDVSNATLTMTGSTLANNRVSYSAGGLGIGKAIAVTLLNSTISGNTAALNAGGIDVNLGPTTLTFVTLTGNVADSDGNGTGDGGGIAGVATIRNSIVAGNIDKGGQKPDCSTNPNSAPLLSTLQNYNLVGNGTGCPSGGTDIVLTGPIASVLNPVLSANGGLTPTHALVADGAARERVPLASCTVTSDQRGVGRPQNALCDIGAVEYTAPPPPCGQRFGDVAGANPACVAIETLASRGIINGCDSSVVPPLFCPTDTTLRHQMAALIVRAMPGWSGETWPNSFTDPTEDAELWGRVATLQHYGVVGGYTAASCQAQGKTPPCYGPLDPVLRAQAISFVTRAMVAHHYWVQQPTDPTLYGGALVGTGHEQDATTYWYYTRTKGGVPDYPEAGGFPLGESAPRAWFARLLWAAIQGTPAGP